MDVYDPQTLGVMVFGGFMVISAIGIFLVSTFSMKETSYEEALAKQRKELEKTQQQKLEKKKKEKPVEKKGKAKKKEEKPNGKIPEQQLTQEVTDPPKDVVLEPAVVPEPVPVESPVAAVPVVPQEKEKPVPSPKEKRKKEKKVAKVEPAPSPVLAAPPVSVPKSSPVLEVTPKEVPVVAVPPVGTQQSAPVIGSATIKKADALLAHEEQKHDGPVKKKTSSKKKNEPAPTDSDGPLYLPYKTLVSTVSSMVFSEGEAQRLIEILTEKTGIIQGTWHTAMQKGDPVAVLKRQLEEKEKQLAAEQEDVAAARNRLRELSKELAAERTKAVAVESKLKEQLLARERDIAAVQARMQASYQDHIAETQQLQGKIRTLQEQLENGPNTQLARLQQENSILRDALNQATSQTESKQNAELAKLRQECNKLMKELSEKSEVLQQEEQQRKSWEIKAVALEKQTEQLQASQREVEVMLQKRLDEVSDELRKTQTSYKTLLADTEKAKGQQQSIAELQAKLLSSEAEVKSKLLELDNVKGKLQNASLENTKLLERIKSIEALLEAGQMREAAKDRDLQATSEAEMKQLQSRLQEKTNQLSSLEREATELREAVEQQKMKNNDLREKNWKAMEALTTVEKTCEEKLLAATKAKEELAQQLDALQTRTKQTLLSALPGVTVSSQQDYDTWLQEFKEKAVGVLKQQMVTTEPRDSALKLKEAEEAQSTLQAECDQYRTILAETEGMLRDLQKSVEQEEQVWKAKLTASEEELQKSHLQLKSLEGMVEKLKADLQSTDQIKEHTSILEKQLQNHLKTASSERQNYTKEVEALRQLLSESQEQLEVAKTETQKQSKELALVRQQLSELKSHVQDGEVAGLQADPSEPAPLKLKTQLEQNEMLVEKEQVLRQKLAQELEEAQRSACSLQAELEKLRLVENAAASDTEEAQHLKERLEKEKKLTKDLGQAATKLQELLKVTQDQLAKERETVKKLKEQLQETGKEDSSKEGTSV
ncbi:PREDICTED: ribosome-binding protein 1 [Acanthisitta chloris]|uniref:Ribosome-binding protein 1 n=1 Tax=Acanthisitta chloris TaxID=57068 RepID=A0A091MFS3_9PASS|nr:PREDICTED: ribosome-binding protein 1 [Acanthisitta chloris]KFP73080.1 Ribosome-binding protein 1 [Acanthisitta chloris]